jgi:hypothetical protein
MRVAQTARHVGRDSTPTPKSPTRLAPRAAPAHDRRSCACGGGCPRCSPAVSSPRDAHEREADDVAEKVMRMAEIAAPPDGGAAPHAAAAANTGGHALPGALRAFFEPRFGVDFSRVRVHADGESAAAASGLRARAYTIGDDIVFAEGEYAPDTSQGRRLIAHELTHVVQQSGGTAPASPQCKEVPLDKDIRGKQDWTGADRVGNTQRWQDACLTNLKAVDSSQYTRIVERRDFYKWFYEFTASQGYTTRWTLAASVVANGAHQIADIDNDLLNEIANEELGLANVELRGYMREGNQVLFDNVLPKLKKLVDGGPLKGAAALKWDMQVLAEEQTLIQPLYTKMSKDSLQQLDDIARQSGIVGYAASVTGEDQVAALPHSKAGTVPAFTGADLKNIGDRWNYGMTLANTFTPGGIGYNPATAKMPSVSADYSSGKEFSKVATRSTLHQLDAWLTSDPATRVGSGKDIVAIIGKLTESEKQQIVSSRGAGDMPYASLFAAAKDVTRAMVQKAMPTDPAFAGAVAQFWKDYDAANRGIVQSYKDLVDTGETLWDLGSDALDFTGGLGDLKF